MGWQRAGGTAQIFVVAGEEKAIAFAYLVSSRSFKMFVESPEDCHMPGCARLEPIQEAIAIVGGAGKPSLLVLCLYG
jgi:hypothetical protein